MGLGVANPNPKPNQEVRVPERQLYVHGYERELRLGRKHAGSASGQLALRRLLSSARSRLRLAQAPITPQAGPSPRLPQPQPGPRAALAGHTLGLVSTWVAAASGWSAAAVSTALPVPLPGWSKAVQWATVAHAYSRTVRCHCDLSGWALSAIVAPPLLRVLQRTIGMGLQGGEANSGNAVTYLPVVYTGQAGPCLLNA